MLILGVNLGSTIYGKPLIDGGASLATDSEILVAIAEERVTRKKYCGGYSKATQYCLGKTEKKMTDLDLIVVSSCVEPIRKVDTSLGFPDDILDRVRVISHHLSHAYSAFFLSPFEEAIIIILDAGGNFLESLKNKPWWEHRREQHTYYLGYGNSIELLERRFDQPNEVGFGELYRCFTKYLGFLSGTNASKLMSIAAYGDETAFQNARLFEYEGERIKSLMKNYPPHITEMVQKWARKQDVSLPPQRMPSEPILKSHMDLARFVQAEFEEAMLNEVRRLYNQTHISNLCIAGGVGLNCVVHQKILKETLIKNIFVQPAPGDTGQCLGNTLWGLRQSDAIFERQRTTFSVYLGNHWNLSKKEIESISHFDHLQTEYPKDLLEEVANILLRGGLVAWFQGGSEFGPRALGNRSILADARFEGTAKRLARTKGREWFRPFAPSVLAEEAQSYFELNNYDYSYMAIVAQTLPKTPEVVPSVVHVDGTSRIQIVSDLNNPLFHKLLYRYWKKSGIPLLINTSFNRSGEPIVESPLDALKCFRQMELDCLVIGDLLIRKKEKNVSMVSDVNSDESMLGGFSVSQNPFEKLVRQILRIDPNVKIAPRLKFGLLVDYWDWILTGKKTTTVRYRPGAIDLPLDSRLPVILSETGKTPSPDLPPVGDVEILSIDIKQYGQLTNEDAVRDGFLNVRELKLNLEKFYGPIDVSEWISIYHIKPINITIQKRKST